MQFPGFSEIEEAIWYHTFKHTQQILYHPHIVTHVTWTRSLVKSQSFLAPPLPSSAHSLGYFHASWILIPATRYLLISHGNFELWVSLPGNSQTPHYRFIPKRPPQISPSPAPPPRTPLLINCFSPLRHLVLSFLISCLINSILSFFFCPKYFLNPFPACQPHERCPGSGPRHLLLVLSHLPTTWSPASGLSLFLSILFAAARGALFKMQIWPPRSPFSCHLQGKCKLLMSTGGLSCLPTFSASAPAAPWLILSALEALNGWGFVLCTRFCCFKSPALLLSWTALVSSFFWSGYLLFTLQLPPMMLSLQSGARCPFSGAPCHLCTPQWYLKNHLYSSASLTRLYTHCSRTGLCFICLVLSGTQHSTWCVEGTQWVFVGLTRSDWAVSLSFLTLIHCLQW